MKKLLLVALVICVAISACKKGDETTAAKTSDSVPTTVSPVGETEPPKTEPIVTEPIVTEPLDEEIKKENVTSEIDKDLEFEVVKFDDEELDAIVMEKSKEVLDGYNFSAEKEFGAEVYYNVDVASLYRSESIVSAVFRGEYEIISEHSERYGEVVYTINIDPKTGKALETNDIVDYSKMIEAFESGRFDVKPDFTNAPYVSVEETDAGVRLGVYVVSGGRYEEVYGYYIAPESAEDFLKIQLTSEE